MSVFDLRVGSFEVETGKNHRNPGMSNQRSRSSTRVLTFVRNPGPTGKRLSNPISSTRINESPGFRLGQYEMTT